MTHLQAAVAAIGLPLDPAWEAAVRFNLELSLRLAREVADFPLDDEAELAPVFTP